MALPPKFGGQLLSTPSSSTSTSAANSDAKHTLELYLDYVCPFSAKLFKTLYTHVVPLLTSSDSKYSNPGLRIIFRQQIQPWHPSSTLVHEAAAAVLRLSPSQKSFWTFSAALFEHQKEYFDVNVVNETRNTTYARLARLAASCGISDITEEKQILQLLEISDQPDQDGGLNTGNKVTDDVKVMVKMNRMQGVHVTPTAVFNGVVAGDISSGWSKEQWVEWLDKNVK